MSNFVAYVSNTDGSINILAGSTNPTVFSKILPEGTEYSVHEGETYTAGGKTYLSDTDKGYIKAKAEEEKQKALSSLDSQYNADKEQLAKEYTDAILNDDTELIEELKAEMKALNEQYDTDYKAIVDEE